jgi:type II secretory ATPase GspE/PulE/Tfp pilus assembly ATPase PilB-like protein
VSVLPKIGFTFEKALRSFLRLDPDIIMIGEMRDLETASAAIEASLTGHMVFSTLHTNNAPETVTRLLDMGLDPYTFGDSLLGILAQRLLRTLCKECKERYVPDQAEWDKLRHEFGDDALFDKQGLRPREGRALPRARLRALQQVRLQGPRRHPRAPAGRRRDPPHDLRQGALQQGPRARRQEGHGDAEAGRNSQDHEGDSSTLPKFERSV